MLLMPSDCSSRRPLRRRSDSAARRARCLARNSSRSSATDFMRAFERIAAERRQHGEDRGKDGDADQNRDEKRRIVQRLDDLIGHRVLALYTSKFIIFFITNTPIDIHTPDTPRIIWPVLVVKSGMM